MSKIKYFLIFSFTALFAVNSYSQEYIKATIKGADVHKRLLKNITYPLKLANDGVESDVLLSLLVKSDGTIDSIKVVQSKYDEFAQCALKAIKQNSKGWTPAIMNGAPVTYRYLVSFRFRIAESYPFIDYDDNIKKLVKKGKLEEALKSANEAIAYSWMESKYYYLRGEIKKSLGDETGAMKDISTANIIDRQLLAVLDVKIAMIIATGTVRSSTIIRVQTNPR